MLYILCLLIPTAHTLSRTSVNGKCQLYFNIINNTNTFASCSLDAASISQQGQSSLEDWSKCHSLCCSGILMTSAQKPQDCYRTVDPKVDKIQSILKMILLLVAIGALLIGGWMARRAYKRRQQRAKQIEGLKDSDLTKSIYKIVWLGYDSSENAQNSCEGFRPEKEQQVQNVRRYDICYLCNKDKVSTYSYCGHSFHAECVHSWWLEHQKCPKCKYHLARMKMYCSCCLNTYFILQKDYFIKLGPITVLCTPCGTKKEFQDRILKHYWNEENGKEGQQVGKQFLQ